MNNDQSTAEIRHDKTTVESLQNIINAINANPTYTIKEEAYILELHELMGEARAREKQADGRLELTKKEGRQTWRDR